MVAMNEQIAREHEARALEWEVTHMFTFRSRRDWTPAKEDADTIRAWRQGSCPLGITEIMEVAHA